MISLNWGKKVKIWYLRSRLENIVKLTKIGPSFFNLNEALTIKKMKQMKIIIDISRKCEVYLMPNELNWMFVNDSTLWKPSRSLQSVFERTPNNSIQCPKNKSRALSMWEKSIKQWRKYNLDLNWIKINTKMLIINPFN